jgi:anti-anti-sigma factor
MIEEKVGVLHPTGLGKRHLRCAVISNDDYSNAMTVDSVEVGDALVVYLVGECDIGTASMLTQEMRHALAERKHVVLDVHLLTYIDSTGIGVIASAQESLVQNKRQLRVVGAHGIFDRIMRLTHLDGLIPQNDSVNEALAAVAGK